MVELEPFNERVTIMFDDGHEQLPRIRILLDDVITRLPNMPQFLNVSGGIRVGTKAGAILILKHVGVPLDDDSLLSDGDCLYSIPDLNNAEFNIFINVDDLAEKTDNYIRGLIAHEFSEFSLAWNTFHTHEDELMSLEPFDRKKRLDALVQNNFAAGTKEHTEHENNVNNEAIRLGFKEEIDALEQNTNIS